MSRTASTRSLDRRITRIIDQVPLVPPRTVFCVDGVLSFCPDPRPLEMPTDMAEGADIINAVAERLKEDDDVVIFMRNDERRRMMNTIGCGYTVARSDGNGTRLIPFQRVVFFLDHAAHLLAKTGYGEYWQVRPWKTGAAPPAQNAVPLMPC